MIAMLVPEIGTALELMCFEAILTPRLQLKSVSWGYVSQHHLLTALLIPLEVVRPPTPCALVVYT